MTHLYDIVVLTHLLGMAAVVGGYAVAYFSAGEPHVSEVMVWGARAQVVTGVVLVGLAEAVDSLGVDLNHPKIGVKLLVALAVAAFAEIGRAKDKRGEFVPMFTNAAGALAIVNVAVAALWS